MLTKFWESAGEGIAGQWLQYIFGPAFLFWGGGLIIIASQSGLVTAWNWISSQDVATQVAMLIIGLLVIVLSSKLMEQLRFSFLRLLEGYWIWPLSYLNLLFTSLQQWLIKRDRKRWNTLMDKKENDQLSAVEKRELEQLESNLHYAPADLDDCMPTSLGNVLQSAESTPRHKYGLDAVICWPRLWLSLPKDIQDVMDSARQTLDTLVELFAWGLFFLVWMFWWRWAFLISIFWMVAIYLLAVQAARTYADLLESAFDMYRWSLYEFAHWPMPRKSGSEEVELGKQLTEFLWRGTTDIPIRYKPKDSK
jgi:hypothetical protein